MSNLLDLHDRLTTIASTDVISKQASDLAVKVAKAIVTDLIQVTPVDSSQALSNWQITLTSPNAYRIPPIYKGFAGSTKYESGSHAIAEAYRILSTKKPGQSIWIQNVLPYIRRLNDGYSTQEPAGFVERAQLIGRKVAEQGL